MDAGVKGRTLRDTRSEAATLTTWQGKAANRGERWRASLSSPGAEGEIAVRGPNVMLGYLKNPETAESAFRNGWPRTGDLARMDEDGYVFVTGRLKELIIKGGEDIAPREIDESQMSWTRRHRSAGNHPI